MENNKQVWVFTSDTHAPVSLDKIPSGDVLVHAGDLQSEGDKEEFKQCLSWLRYQKHTHKFLIPGNHDFYLDQFPGPALQTCRSAGVMVLGMPNNAAYEKRTLENGLVIGGMPLVMGLENRWAFGESSYAYANPERYGFYQGIDFKEHFKNAIVRQVQALIKECDVIVTHAPLFGCLDQDGSGVHKGNTWFKEALDSVADRRVQLWVHGHMHESVGYETLYGRLEDQSKPPLQICNVAMCNRSNEHAYRPTVFDWSPDSGFACRVKPGSGF